MDHLAPILLFVYNRPEHTLKTLRALSNNVFADSSQLFIYVRNLISEFDWPGTKEIVLREENFGLARNIIEGVTEILDKFEKVIVLEDDLVTSDTFLIFMNNALNTYDEETKVYQISGYMIPHRIPFLKHSFLRVPGSWGWGTWRRAWDGFSTQQDSIYNLIRQENKYEFNLNGSYPHYNILMRNKEGKLNTWAVKWYAFNFHSRSLCLYPSRSLVRNIGHDGTGENCASGRNDLYGNQKIFNIEKVDYRKPIESLISLILFKVFYKRRKVVDYWDVVKYVNM